jgi:hypothetical protein
MSFALDGVGTVFKVGISSSRSSRSTALHIEAWVS